MTIQEIKQMYHLGLLNYIKDQGVPKKTQSKGIVYIEEPNKIGVIVGDVQIIFKPKFNALGAKDAYLLSVLTPNYVRRVLYHLTQSQSLHLMTKQEKEKHVSIINVISKKYSDMVKEAGKDTPPPKFDKYEVTYIAEKPR